MRLDSTIPDARRRAANGDVPVSVIETRPLGHLLFVPLDGHYAPGQEASDCSPVRPRRWALKWLAVGLMALVLAVSLPALAAILRSRGGLW